MIKMSLANAERCLYDNSPLTETICQIKFPPILTIGAKEPVEFQEAVRGDFPRYAQLKEQAAPRIVGAGTPNARFETPEPTVNYQFISADGLWKVNLTRTFIAISTLRYQGWEDFAKRLDKLLMHFIGIYKPAFFERIGLRYINAVSRKKLDLEDTPWSELINPAYIGVLDEEDVRETSVAKCSTDVEMLIPGGCRLRLHAGPGIIQRPQSDKEVRFIIDQDVSFAGNIAMEHTAGTLSSLHLNAQRVFRGAITDRLHEAMGPHEV